MIHSLHLNAEIEGEVTALAFGGNGILRYQRFVIFIPFTAPGDQIICRITEIKKSFAKAELIKLKQPSKLRVAPKCPYFGKCGGCQLQHLNDEAQLNYKFSAVSDALKRIGHLTIPTIDRVPVQTKWAYRRHITLHLKPFGQGFQAGYISSDHVSFLPIEICPIFNLSNDSIITFLQQFVSFLPNNSLKDGRVNLLKSDHLTYILSFQFSTLGNLKKHLFQDALQKYPLFAGILVYSPEEKWEFGNVYAHQTIDNLMFQFTPQTFIQNNLEQSTNIYKKICLTINHDKPKKILDLYCGFGITSLLLAKQGHSITGMEYNSEAIRFAKNNSQLNRLTHAKFLEGDVDQLLPKYFKSQRADTIIVNPPREGLSKNVVQILLKNLPEEIIYISCMPTTLARDLSFLCQNHYEIKECCIYDMFPQTSHVETFIYLRKR